MKKEKSEGFPPQLARKGEFHTRNARISHRRYFTRRKAYFTQIWVYRRAINPNLKQKRKRLRLPLLLFSESFFPSRQLLHPGIAVDLNTRRAALEDLVGVEAGDDGIAVSFVDLLDLLGGLTAVGAGGVGVEIGLIEVAGLGEKVVFHGICLLCECLGGW